MTHDRARTDELAMRMARLERAVRGWRVAALAVAAAAAAPWLVGAGSAGRTSEDLRASSLTLVGPDGLERATLRLENGEPVLTLQAPGRRVSLTLADGNAGLACSGEQGVAFAGISATGAYFNARGSDLRRGVFAGVAAEGPAAFRAYGSDMQACAALESSPDGRPVLRLSHPERGVTTLPGNGQ